MKLYQQTSKLCSLVLVVLISGITACSSMHDPYEDFIKDGEIIYPGTPDSVMVSPGYKRIQLSWPMPTDPTITDARISWHNGQESVDVSIDSIQVEDEARVMLEDLEAGSYTFTILHFDEEGNTSIDMTTTGRVYGDVYANSLLQRILSEAVFLNDTLKIEWGNADESAFATEIDYLSTSGDSSSIYATGESTNTMVPDYDFSAGNTIQYRTLHKPDSLAIDTFYTAFETVRVYGPRVEYDKTGWTATASSYDERHGTARAPSSAIDNDPSTIWVNQISTQTYYPHWIKIDMGDVEKADGISFDVQNRSETPRTIEIRLSEDNVNWTTIGIFNLERTAVKQNIDFSETHNVRYVEVTATESYGSNNIVIGEIGIYTR